MFLFFTKLILEMDIEQEIYDFVIVFASDATLESLLRSAFFAAKPDSSLIVLVKGKPNFVVSLFSLLN